MGNEGFDRRGDAFSEGVMEKGKIVNILMDEFSYVYCFNCNNNLDEDLCGDCHRKYMNWRLSESTAEEIADKILEVMRDG